jgi:hypothetical protein
MIALSKDLLLIIMIFLNFLYAITQIDSFIQKNTNIESLDKALNKIYKQISKDKIFIHNQKIWIQERNKVINSKYTEKENDVELMYHERIKYLLLKDEYYKSFILQNFETIAATDELHSVDAIILRYALMLLLGTNSFDPTGETQRFRYIWKIKDKEYLLMWTLGAGNKLGSHMFFYIVLDSSITFRLIPFYFNNHQRAIHSFDNNPTVKKDVLTIWDNMGQFYQYVLKDQTLQLIK